MVFEVNETSKIYCGFRNEERYCEIRINNTIITQLDTKDEHPFKKYVFDRNQDDSINLNFTRAISYSNQPNEIYIAVSYSSSLTISITKHSFKSRRISALDSKAIIGS